MHKETTLNYKSILEEMRFIGFGGIIFSSVFCALTYFSILYYQLHLFSTVTGTILGVILGVFLVHRFTYKAHPKLGKIKTEMNRIYRTYRNTKAAATIISLYILSLEVIVFSTSTYTYTFRTSEFTGYVIYSTLASFLLYVGIGYATAWYNYKEHHQNPK